MEISPFTVYLWQQADSLITLFRMSSVVLVMVSIALVVASVFISDSPSYNSKEEQAAAKAAGKSFFFKGALPSIAMFVISTALSFLTPSTKTIAIMYAVPTIVNSKPIQQDLPELYQMGVEALKVQLAPKTPAKVESAAKQ